MKNGDAQCIRNIWNRRSCNYDVLDDAAVFAGLCWYPSRRVMVPACTGALNWKRGHTVGAGPVLSVFLSAFCLLNFSSWLMIIVYVCVK